jgi:hypothetical protein
MRVYSKTCLMSLSTRLSGCFLALLLLIFSSAVHSAHADELWDFAQITCAPELGYFSIRRISILDLPHMGPYLTEGLEPGPAVVTTLQRKYGIFDSDSLQANPFECSIPEAPAVQGRGDGHPGYKVRVIGHLDKNSQESSYSMIADNAEIFLQEKSLGLVVLNLTEGTDSIEVWYDAALEVRTCRVIPGTNLGNAQDITCRYEPFKAGAQ